MADVSYEQILVDRDGPVAVVTFNRPDRMNAWTWRLAFELRHAFVTMDTDDDVRAIVVTGAGRAFMAGADLESGGGTFTGDFIAERQRLEAEFAVPNLRPWEMRTPIIAAMNGHAVGVGLTYPMQWDIRYVAENAKLGFVFTRRGVIPEANSTWIVPRLIGASRALELMLSGRTFSGAEAAEWGLVSRAMPADEVLPASIELAHGIARDCAPVSVAITKRLVHRFLTEPDRGEAESLEDQLFAWCGGQPDAAEGVGAFLEKRQPAWKMGKASDFPAGML